MRLKVMLPTERLVDEEVNKVIAEAEDGAFCILPRHIDFVAPLVAGLLQFERADGAEEFVAIDDGTLVKTGSEVLVATRNGVRGADLGNLRATVEQRFRTQYDRESSARAALAKLESNLVRRFMELGDGWRD